MRRLDIIMVFSTFRRQSLKPELLQHYKPVNRQDKSPPSGILSALNAFSLAASKFPPATLELMRIFDIEGFSRPVLDIFPGT